MHLTNHESASHPQPPQPPQPDAATEPKPVSSGVGASAESVRLGAVEGTRRLSEPRMRREQGELRIDLPAAGMSGPSAWLVPFTAVWFLGLLAYYIVLATMPDGAELWYGLEQERDRGGYAAEREATPGQPVRLMDEEPAGAGSLEFSERAALLQPYYIFFWWLPLVAVLPGLVLMALALRSATSRSTLHVTPAKLIVESRMALFGAWRREIAAESIQRIEIDHEGGLRVHLEREVVRVPGRTLRRKPGEPVALEQLPPCGRFASKEPLDETTRDQLWRWEPAHAIAAALQAMYGKPAQG